MRDRVVFGSGHTQLALKPDVKDTHCLKVYNLCTVYNQVKLQTVRNVIVSFTNSDICHCVCVCPVEKGMNENEYPHVTTDVLNHIVFMMKIQSEPISYIFCAVKISFYICRTDHQSPSSLTGTRSSLFRRHVRVLFVNSLFRKINATNMTKVPRDQSLAQCNYMSNKSKQSRKQTISSNVVLFI